MSKERGSGVTNHMNEHTLFTFSHSFANISDIALKTPGFGDSAELSKIEV